MSADPTPEYDQLQADLRECRATLAAVVMQAGGEITIDRKHRLAAHGRWQLAVSEEMPSGKVHVQVVEAPRQRVPKVSNPSLNTWNEVNEEWGTP